MSSIGSYSAEKGLDAALDGTRGGESVWVLVLGVPNDQASMSSRMSETSNGSDVRGRARGTTIESGLRTGAGDEVDASGTGSLRGSRVGAGAGGARCEGCVAVLGEEGRGIGGGRDLSLGKVGSICELGPGVRGGSGRGLLILLRGGRLVRRLELRGGGRRESGRAGQSEGTSGKQRVTISPNSREYHNASSSSSSSCSSSVSSSSGPSEKKDSRVNSKASVGLASEIKRDGVDLEAANG